MVLSVWLLGKNLGRIRIKIQTETLVEGMNTFGKNPQITYFNYFLKLQNLAPAFRGLRQENSSQLKLALTCIYYITA